MGTLSMDPQTGGTVYDPKPKKRTANPCLKERKVGNPYEVWVSGDWTWNVLKKWQADDNKPYARWFCHVVTPMTGPSGDLGDVYVQDIKRNARRATCRQCGQWLPCNCQDY